ncbi:gametogenetin-binding protein 2-like [Antedon mediterranea]|uniref:gametogenetin-binding protein 2-like n=1 Tax=Antedon mediterranea TaxID=105859 RepID=UPI003AF90F5B
MAKLIAVCSKSAKDKPYKFEELQVPLEVEDNLKMVMQLPVIEKVQCNHNPDDIRDKKFHRNVDIFAKKMDLLSRDELAATLLIPSKEVFSSMLVENITCVGCRRSIEQMFKQLKDQGLVSALDPLVITTRSELSLNPSFLYSPWNMHSLFNVQGTKLASILEALPRKKGSKRCALHSLDSHKSKPNGNWIEIWEALEAPCREEVTLISASSLQVTMDAYLRKHRFCTECKSKVTRAFNILIGEIEPSKEKGYCAHIYDGLRSCPLQKHIHLLCETNFIHKLIMRAEPEMSGVRERHAKTIDVAQEEVLTCLGLHVHERLFKISQKLRAEEQTCQLLFYLGVERLRKAFEVTIESKRGMSMLEQVCEEINEADKLKQHKKEQKKLRRKAKKKSVKCAIGACLEDKSQINTCDCGSEKAEKDVFGEVCLQDSHFYKCKEENDLNDNEVNCGSCGPVEGGVRNDCGYCSSSSPEQSEVACTDGVCNHENTEYLESCDTCQQDDVDEICPDCEMNVVEEENEFCQRYGKLQSAPFTCLLQDMLDKGENEDSGDFIAAEDIAKFKLENKNFSQKRKKLRAKLLREFQEKFVPGNNGEGYHHRCCHHLDKCTSEISQMFLD